MDSRPLGPEEKAALRRHPWWIVLAMWQAGRLTYHNRMYRRHKLKSMKLTAKYMHGEFEGVMAEAWLRDYNRRG